MADQLGDLYPLPVEFIDGQQPTAAFFNAWANQIDIAFGLLSKILGDYDGTSTVTDTYVSNLCRAFGNMGWINNRLPEALRIPVPNGGGPGTDLPWITEKLAAWTGEKVAELSFVPEPDEANDAEITEVDLGAGVAKGTFETENMAGVGSFILKKKKLLVNTPILATATITYPIDTSADDFRDTVATGSGANLIPSFYEVASPLADLCTVSQPAGYGANEYRVDFPAVRRIMHPSTPFSTDEAETIKLDDAATAVYWDTTGARTAPLYPIPTNIWALLVGVDFPNNVIHLWHDNAGTITRLRPTDGTSFTWEAIPGTVNALKFTVPAGFAVPAPLNRYIVAFAGTSVSEAINELRAFSIRHSHDGSEGSLVSAMDLKDAFGPAEFYHSTIHYNPFPQYLHRGGWQTDTLNRNNVMLGDLVIGPSDALPTNSEGPEDLTVDSHMLWFGDHTDGPRFFFDVSDTEGSGAADTAGKLQASNKSLRVRNHLFVGAVGRKSYLDGSQSGTEETLSHLAQGETEDNIVFASGTLRSRNSRLEFMEDTSDGYLTYNDNDLVTPPEFLFDNFNPLADTVVKSDWTRMYAHRPKDVDTFNIVTVVTAVEMEKELASNDFNGWAEDDAGGSGLQLRDTDGGEVEGWGGTQADIDEIVYIPVKVPLSYSQQYETSEARTPLPEGGIKLKKIEIQWLSPQSPGAANQTDYGLVLTEQDFGDGEKKTILWDVINNNMNNVKYALQTVDQVVDGLAEVAIDPTKMYDLAISWVSADPYYIMGVRYTWQVPYMS